MLNQIFLILAVVLLVTAVGAVVLSSRPALREISQTLWAIAIVCIAATLGLLIALDWF
jgi:FtsH-binding integral membrane protein